jgi:Fe-S oxidoreductase
VGAAPERAIPAFAAQSFQRWFASRPAKNRGAPRVLLFADTFNNYFTPETAQAAVMVLEDAGFQVRVPRGHLCCGRPLYDYGFLDRARRYLHHVLDRLRDDLAARTPVVVLEPSCAAVFRDELRNLLPEDGHARTLAQSTFLLSELLVSSHTRALGYEVPRLARRAVVQGHCHHKAIMGTSAAEQVLERMDVEAEVLASGCCGMAGSFGYEAGDRYRVSMAAGERVLLPAVRGAPADTLVLADGFSCKQQIAEGTDRSALHLAEALRMALEHGPAGIAGACPEREMTRARVEAQRRSMRRAGAAVLAIGAAALGLGFGRLARHREPAWRRWVGSLRRPRPGALRLLG